MLTERQREVLVLAARGWGCKEIAQRLGISRQTIKNHLYAAYAALGAHNLAHAVAIALIEQEISAAAIVINLPPRRVKILAPAGGERPKSG